MKNKVALGSIYCIKNMITGQIYIGQTRGGFGQRKSSHLSLLRKDKHSNEHLQNSFNKYGFNSFSFEVLEKCSIELLDQREIEYIAQFEAMDRSKGFNKTEGGQNYYRTDQTRNKLSRIKSRPTQYQSSFNYQHKNKDNTRSEAKRGAKNPMYGKVPINARAVRCVETGQIFDSLQAAAKHHKIWPQNLWHCLNGKIKRSGGYSFEYI